MTKLTVNRSTREKLYGQKGKVFWMTGLSASGKSTIADAFEKTLHERGLRTYILDGDNLRRGLNKDLGFVEADRIENIRRVAEVAKLMVDAVSTRDLPLIQSCAMIFCFSYLLLTTLADLVAILSNPRLRR